MGNFDSDFFGSLVLIAQFISNQFSKLYATPRMPLRILNIKVLQRRMEVL
uniref:Uncharacterized protein n=1 Tax=Rhizophora mucronata TaxID=61149 RepID=A0A2P2QUV2_RHIMU